MPAYFDMPSSCYTIDDAGTKSVFIKTLGSQKNAADCNVDGVGRRHKTTTICGIKLKAMPEA
jgi:hypothetical protein